MKSFEQLFKLLFIAVCFLMLSCDKKDGIEVPPTEPTESPERIEIVSGGNQSGYKDLPLPELVCIEITPKNPKDIEHYYYQFETWEVNVVEAENKGDRLVLKVQFTLRHIDLNQKTTISLYSTLNQNENGMNKPIATIDINAKLKAQWRKIFEYTGHMMGPGEFLDIHFSDDLNGVVIGDFFNGNLRTIDGGITWEFTDRFFDMFRLTFYDNLNGFVETVNSWAYFTNDGGNTFFKGEWTPPFIAHRGANDYVMVDKNTIFSVGNRGTIVKSVDSGKTWETYKGFNFVNSLRSIFLVNRNTLFACGQVGKIVKTTDGGESWSQMDLEMNNDFNKICFIDEKIGFAGGSYGALVRTIDGGNTWRTVVTNVLYPIIDIHFFNDKLGYIVTSSGEIAKSTDGGATWRLVVIASYGISTLTKVLFKNTETILGISEHSIFKYELDNK